MNLEEFDQIIDCPICFEKFGIYDDDDFASHIEICCEQNNFNNYDDIDNTIDNIIDNTCHNEKNKYVEPELTKAQKKAYKYCKAKAKIHSNQTKGLVLIRFLENGYTEDDYNTVINNIKNCVRITINIYIKTILQHMLNDKYIKNGYETGRFLNVLFDVKSNSRSQWESNLFNKEYDNAEGYERVKYGALNILNEPNGISQCKYYGDSFFVLKNDLKNRISFVCGDSASQMLHICTFKYCEQLLIHPTNEHFNAIVNRNSSVINKRDLSDLTNLTDLTDARFPYIEAQIHGPVRLNSDIEKFCISDINFNKLDFNDKENIKVFCDKNNIQLCVYSSDKSIQSTNLINNF